MSKTIKVILFALIFIFVVLPVLGFAVFNFVSTRIRIDGSTMFPNYNNGQYYAVSKIAYDFSVPQRGDVVLMSAPPDDSQEFVKRIVGLSGDQIKVSGTSLYINDQKLSEPYLASDIITLPGTFIADKNVLIPDGEYAVFGDNRPHSLDSRYFGFITKKEIIGKLWFCYANCN